MTRKNCFKCYQNVERFLNWDSDLFFFALRRPSLWCRRSDCSVLDVFHSDSPWLKTETSCRSRIAACNLIIDAAIAMGSSYLREESISSSRCLSVQRKASVLGLRFALDWKVWVPLAWDDQSPSTSAVNIVGLLLFVPRDQEVESRGGAVKERDWKQLMRSSCGRAAGGVSSNSV